MKTILIAILLSLCFQSHAEVLQVGEGFPFTTIKSAFASCHHGDTIVVNSGIYKEGNLVIDKSISFLGKGKPVLDGEYKYEVLSIKADFVNVTGFIMRHSGHSSMEDMGGIKIYDSHHVNITGNTLEDNFFGIYLQYSKNCLIRDNHISASQTEQQLMGNGIHCWKSDSLQIIANTVSGHRDGIYFEFVTASVIWRNTAFNNMRYGLHFMFSNNDAYITNIFRNNGAGVAVMFTKNVKMVNNTFVDNWGDAAYGLLLKEISDSYIFNNRFSSNTSGIFMEGTSRIKLENNTFNNNGWGMKIQASCMDNEVRYNNFLRNTFDVGTNGSLTLNKFENNFWDKYEGYDLDKDRIGDVPFRPLSLFSVIVEKYPTAMILYRSFIVTLLDRSEKIIPTLTPGNFIDETPAMQAYSL